MCPETHQRKPRGFAMICQNSPFRPHWTELHPICTRNTKSHKTLYLCGFYGFLNGGLAGTRTPDQCLKRALLYQLSYQPGRAQENKLKPPQRKPFPFPFSRTNISREPEVFICRHAHYKLISCHAGKDRSDARTKASHFHLIYEEPIDRRRTKRADLRPEQTLTQFMVVLEPGGPGPVPAPLTPRLAEPLAQPRGRPARGLRIRTPRPPAGTRLRRPRPERAP